MVLVTVLSFVAFATTIALSIYLILELDLVVWGLVAGGVALISAIIWSSNVGSGGSSSRSSSSPGATFSPSVFAPFLGGGKSPEEEKEEDEAEIQQTLNAPPPLQIQFSARPKPSRPKSARATGPPDTSQAGEIDAKDQAEYEKLEEQYQSDLKAFEESQNQAKADSDQAIKDWEAEKLLDLENQRALFEQEQKEAEEKFNSAIAAANSEAEKQDLERQRKEFQESEEQRRQQAEKELDIERLAVIDEARQAQEAENQRVAKENQDEQIRIDQANAAEVAREEAEKAKARAQQDLREKAIKDVEALEKEVSEERARVKLQSENDSKQAFEDAVEADKQKVDAANKILDDRLEAFQAYKNEKDPVLKQQLLKEYKRLEALAVKEFDVDKALGNNRVEIQKAKKKDRIERAKGRSKNEWLGAIQTLGKNSGEGKVEAIITEFGLSAPTKDDLRQGLKQGNGVIDTLAKAIRAKMQKSSSDKLVAENSRTLIALLDSMDVVEDPVDIPKPKYATLKEADFKVKADDKKLKRLQAKLAKLQQAVPDKPGKVTPAKIKTFSPKFPKQIKPKVDPAKMTSKFKPGQFKPKAFKAPKTDKFKPAQFKPKAFTKTKPGAFKPGQFKGVKPSKPKPKTKSAAPKPGEFKPPSIKGVTSKLKGSNQAEKEALMQELLGNKDSYIGIVLDIVLDDELAKPQNKNLDRAGKAALRKTIKKSLEQQFDEEKKKKKKNKS